MTREMQNLKSSINSFCNKWFIDEGMYIIKRLVAKEVDAEYLSEMLNYRLIDAILIAQILNNQAYDFNDLKAVVNMFIYNKCIESYCVDSIEEFVQEYCYNYTQELEHGDIARFCYNVTREQAIADLAQAFENEIKGTERYENIISVRDKDRVDEQISEYTSAYASRILF